MAAKKPCTLLALLLADTVLQEPETKKASVVGLFTSIVASRFPTNYPKFSIFALLEGLKPGQHRATVHIYPSKGAKRNTPKLEAFVNAEPGKLAQLQFALAGLRFRKPGIHFVDLSVGGSFVGRRQLHAVLSPRLRQK